MLLDKIWSASRSSTTRGFRRYSVIDSTVSSMSLLRTKRVLCAFVTVAICASCASLKPVKEQSVISDVDVPSGITTSPGLGVDGTRVPDPGIATPSVITQPPSATQDSYRTLSSLLLARGDLPNAWEEDTSGSGASDTAEGWLGLGSCLRTPVPVLEVSGSSFSNEAVFITTTASLFSSPSEVQASLAALDGVQTGGLSNTCLKDYIGDGYSDSSTKAFVTKLDVESAELEAPNRAIRATVNVVSDGVTGSFTLHMMVVSQGSVTLLMLGAWTDEASTTHGADLGNVYKLVFDRLAATYGTR